jgi:hypothetical protein
MYTTKNYSELGGNRWTIGGDINVVAGAKVLADGTQATAIADHADTTTATTEEIATKQNAILAALRGAGIIASE